MSIRTDLNEMLLRDIFEAYQRAEETMLERIAKRIKRGVTETGWTEEKFNDVQKLRREIEATLKDVNQLAKAKLSDGIIKAYKTGVASASKDMKKVESILNDFVPEHIQRMILETNNLIDNTSFQILRNTQDVYRQVISETSTQALLGVETRLETAQNALNMFAARGITGFVDRAGRRWDLASYVEMATRTATARAALQGHIDRQIEIGNDLVMVSSIGTTCPICAQWQGKVLSISGNDKRYPSLESAKAAGLFHPNCKHTITAYFPEIDDYEPPVTKNNPEKYEATQKQRYNERQIRKWKRVEAAAMTPEAKAKAANMVKKWQAIQREHVAKWDLRRQYGRESIKNRVGDASKVRTKSEPKPTSKPTPKPTPKPAPEFREADAIENKLLNYEDYRKELESKFTKDELSIIDKLRGIEREEHFSIGFKLANELISNPKLEPFYNVIEKVNGYHGGTFRDVNWTNEENDAFKLLMTKKDYTLYRVERNDRFGNLSVGDKVTFDVPMYTSREEEHTKGYMGKDNVKFIIENTDSLRLGYADTSEKAELVMGDYFVDKVMDEIIDGEKVKVYRLKKFKK